MDRPKVTIASYKPTLKDHAGPQKHVRHCLVDHQVHAALPKASLFHVNNDCKYIERHYSGNLYAKHC